MAGCARIVRNVFIRTAHSASRNGLKHSRHAGLSPLARFPVKNYICSHFFFKRLNRLNWQTGKPDNAALRETLFTMNLIMKLELKHHEAC
jgi:hypothetical protein